MNSSIVLNSTASFHVQSLLQNCGNFRSSGDVARLMYFDGYNWVDYEMEVVEAVRVCWEGVVEVRIGGGIGMCVFDFYRMLVLEVGTGIEKSVAWIDVDGNCFFPKCVVGEVSSFRGLGEVEIEVRVSGGELVMREGENVVDEVKSGLRDDLDGLGKVRVSGGELVSERMREGENVVDEVKSSLREGSGGDLDGLGKVRVSGGELVSERMREGENVVDEVKSSLRDDLDGLGKVRVSGGELLNERKREGGNEVKSKVISLREGSGGDSEGLGKLGIGGRVSGGELANKRKREGDDEVESVGSCSNVIKKRGGQLSNKRKREGDDEVKSVGSCSNVIKREEVSEVESMRWKKARVIGDGGKVGMVVKNLFLNWPGIKGIGVEITGIHQITRTSAVDKARYEGFMNQVEITKAARGDANVTFAWVKCSSQGVETILTHGFTGPVKGSLGEGYGVGVYLSPFNSTGVSVLHQDAGENHVIFCRVILGKCEKVQAGSQQLYPSSVEFDTGVDDVSNPKWYIVWDANMNSHILPECVVSYKHTCYLPGQLSGTQRFGQASARIPKMANAMTAKFFAQLLRSLPSSKLPELRTLCSTYKAGKVPKGIFMKKLRSVVGDQMLRTAMQEFRGWS